MGAVVIPQASQRRQGWVGLPPPLRQNRLSVSYSVPYPHAFSALNYHRPRYGHPLTSCFVHPVHGVRSGPSPILTRNRQCHHIKFILIRLLWGVDHQTGALDP